MTPISPSQLSKFAPRTGCPRAWAGRYIFGHKDPDSPHAEFGTRIHTVGENYALSGVQPDPNDEAGLRFIPALPYYGGPGMENGQPEYEFTIKLGGITWQGSIDRLSVDPDGVPHVRDLKSTKNPRKKWQGKKAGLDTREDFLTDAQWLVYGIAALVWAPGSQRVRGTWIYIATEGAPYAEPRRIECTKAEMLAAFNLHVQRWAVPLVQIRMRKPTNLLHVPPNVAHCDRYRSRSRDPEKRAAAPGCRLRHLCTDVTDSDRAFAALDGIEDMAKTNDELLDELRREQRDPKINGPVRKGGKAMPELEDDEEDDLEPAPAPRGGKGKPVADDLDDELEDRAARPTKSKPAPADDLDDEDEPEVTPAPAPRKSKAKVQEPVEAIEDKPQTELRDMFAAAALETARALVGGKDVLTLSHTAYAIADAMLEARKR